MHHTRATQTEGLTITSLRAALDELVESGVPESAEVECSPPLGKGFTVTASWADPSSEPSEDR